MKALEIPTDPVTGISLEALELALEQWPIKLIQITPAVTTHSATSCPRRARRLCSAWPSATMWRSWKTMCTATWLTPTRARAPSSHSTTMAACCSAVRSPKPWPPACGWLGGTWRYLERVLHMKYISTGSSASQPQLAIADFIAGGHYQPHMRRMRSQYQRGRDLMSDWVTRYFPAGTRVSRPQGGFMLWVEFPEHFDTLRLNRALLEQGVPGGGGQYLLGLGQVPPLPAHELRRAADATDRGCRTQGR